MAKQNKTSHLSLRVLPDLRKTVERAAKLKGLSMTEFATRILEREARAVIHRHEQSKKVRENLKELREILAGKK